MRRSGLRVIQLAIGAIGLWLPTMAGAQTYSVLYSFPGSSGAMPEASPLLIGSTLYGTTPKGGASNDGTVFSINTDGTGYTVLHAFTGGTTDGNEGFDTLVNVGSTLYGATAEGGTSNDGTIFKVNADGTGYSVLHSFAGPTSDGQEPSFGPMVYSNGALYGTTIYGGGVGGINGGVIYRINPDGSGYTVIHTFASSTDGANPYGGLIAVGSTLYGTAYSDGPNNHGSIFSINEDGSDFDVLHSFANSTDGYLPRTTLLDSNGVLYGTTTITVFSMNLDGSSYDVLHTFSGNPDGKIAESSLALVGSTLYGTTDQGGTSNIGALFEVNTDGSDYAVIHSFTGATSDGDFPQNGPIADGSVLYGLTFEGGADSLGTLYSVTVPEPTTGLLILGSAALMWPRRRTPRTPC